jgi:phosphoribosylamine---glycine ligase
VATRRWPFFLFMRILLMSAFGDGLWMGALMEREGHSVSYALTSDRFDRQLAGIIGSPLVIIGKDDIESPEKYDLVVFDLTGMGEAADYARTMTPTIGDSVFADTLEHDRLFGIEFMQKCGIAVPPFEHFTDPADAISYLKKTKKRVVFKPCGPSDTSSTYVSKDFEDMIRYMDVLFRKSRVKEFILQTFIPGTEVSTEMWVTQDGYCAVNHTIETKKLMSGDIGPATGCSSAVTWMPARETAAFKNGLKKTAGALNAEGYCGPIDLNSICADGELYGLEWTPRFGYEGACNLTRLLPVPFGAFCFDVASGKTPSPLIAKHAFSATIRLSIPPYPLEGKARALYSEGVPIEGIDLKRDLPNFFLSDVRLVPDSDQLETAGESGFIGAPIGVGDTLAEAFGEVVDKIKSLDIPNLQWRNDAPECCSRRYRELEENGWIRQS